MSEVTKAGRAITFYSFKGGVGRSVALLNIAVLLAKAHRVLVVDFDLEAPGLERYLAPFQAQDGRADGGMMEILQEAIHLRNRSGIWKQLLSQVEIDKGRRFDFLRAGNVAGDYSQRVQEFDWNVFFAKHRGGAFVDGLRAEWTEAYDFVLIDSRTGYTDIGGICTVQFPDIIAMTFTANDQSLNGCLEVLQRIEEARRALPEARMPLTILPVPSYIDRTTEYELSKEWQERFAKEWASSCAPWMPAEVDMLRLIERVTVPYVAYYSFGERLAVVRDRITDSASPAYAYAALARILEQDFQEIETVLDEALSEEKAGVPEPSNALKRRLAPIRDKLTPRQVMMLAQVEATGAVTSGWCKEVFKVVYDTANRDLRHLQDLGLLIRQGAGRSTRYTWSKLWK
jgi:hypothetical protein